MKPASFLLSMWLLTCPVCSAAQCGQQTAATNAESGTLKSQVGVALNAQQLIPARPAIVVVMYESGMVNGSFAPGHAPFRVNNPDTAGGQYKYQLETLRSTNKELKALLKVKRPDGRQYDQFSKLSLAAIDEALLRASDWLSNHPERSWEMVRTTADAEGCWSVEGLKPGSYKIVVRGRVKGHDADWEGEVDLSPGRTIALPLTTPHYLRSGGD